MVKRDCRQKCCAFSKAIYFQVAWRASVRDNSFSMKCQMRYRKARKIAFSFSMMHSIVDKICGNGMSYRIRKMFSKQNTKFRIKIILDQKQNKGYSLLHSPSISVVGRY